MITYRTSTVWTSPIVGILPLKSLLSNNLSRRKQKKWELILLAYKIYAKIWTYMCMSFMSELKSFGGMEPESWFLLKWLHQITIKKIIDINYNTQCLKKTKIEK
jgi:hypothetical protein